MDAVFIRRQLAINRDRIAALARGVSEDQGRWKPDPESWSVLEVVCHLTDEEELDFSVRLKLVLEGSTKPWPEIDPPGWVEEHKYHEQDLFQTLNRFVSLRNENLAWLEELEAQDWDIVGQAPFGEIRAGDLLSAWAAHDLLHLRQLVELAYLYLRDQADPYQVIYAGEWQNR